MSAAPTGERAKAYGAFYTDAVVADFLAWWALRSANDTVMDPSFGGGVFLEAAAQRLRARGGNPSQQVFGVELDPEVHERVLSELHTSQGLEPSHLVLSDFFELDPGRLKPLNAIIGNPPFIRYQSFQGRARERALSRAAEQGVTLNKLASSWAAFVVHSAAFLEPAGRLAMVIPMELGHASYARPVLDFLTRTFGSVTLLTFKERLFPELSQDTMLVLAEGKGETFSGFYWRDLCSLNDLPEIRGRRYAIGNTERLDETRLVSGQDRLIMHLISDEARGLYERLSQHPQVEILGELANVGIGYVSGANRFFHLSPEDVETWEIPDRYLKPAVYRSKAFTGLKFDHTDWQRATGNNEAGYLLALDNSHLPKSVERYLEHGKEQGVPTAYKCRVRSPWYAVPNVYEAEAFLTYMSGLRPQLVANDAAAVTPNTLHTVRFKGKSTLTGDALAAYWQTSLTSLSVELEGHALGGGMLKLEPGEAKRVLVAAPQATPAVQELAEHLDMLLRKGKNDEARQCADKMILLDMLNLTEQDVKTLSEAASLLQTRRYHQGRHSVASLDDIEEAR